VCYFEAVKHVTVSLPDEVYQRVTLKAAERETTVSGLVRELLTEVASEESDFERRKRLQNDVIASIKEFRAGDRLSREEVHERAAVR
jgi:metal-responsive CopG/Arc/MetJ family transcriptional regulator